MTKLSNIQIRVEHDIRNFLEFLAAEWKSDSVTGVMERLLEMKIDRILANPALPISKTQLGNCRNLSEKARLCMGYLLASQNRDGYRFRKTWRKETQREENGNKNKHIQYKEFAVVGPDGIDINSVDPALSQDASFDTSEPFDPKRAFKDPTYYNAYYSLDPYGVTAAIFNLLKSDASNLKVELDPLWTSPQTPGRNYDDHKSDA